MTSSNGTPKHHGWPHTTCPHCGWVNEEDAITDYMAFHAIFTCKACSSMYPDPPTTNENKSSESRERILANIHRHRQEDCELSR